MGMLMIKRICHNCLVCLTKTKSVRRFCLDFQSSIQTLYSDNVSSLKHDTQRRIIFSNSRISIRARKFATKSKSKTESKMEDQDSWSSSSSWQEVVRAEESENLKPKATGRRRGRPSEKKQSPQIDADVKKATVVLSDAEKQDRYVARQEEKEVFKKYPFLIERAKQVYVLDERLADEIVLTVRENQTDPSVPVLEANPGPGVVTRALLKSGVTRIIAAEALPKFIPYLSEEVASQNNKQEVILLNWDHFSLYQRLGDSHLQCSYKNFETKMAEMISHKSWGEGPPLTVVGVIPATKDRKYLTHLVMSCAQRYGLFALGRPEWFLIVSPSMYKNILVQGLDSRAGYGNFFTHLGITLSLMFDIKLCGQFSGWKFIPHFRERKKHFEYKEVQGVSDNMRYLLRLRPHQEQLLPLSDFPVFHSFLYQVLKAKKQRLILKMEQLIPGSGIHLLMSGFSLMMTILQVSPQQFLSIFKAMRSWPEYEGSPMKEFLCEPSNLVLDDDHHEDSHDEKED